MKVTRAAQGIPNSRVNTSIESIPRSSHLVARRTRTILACMELVAADRKIPWRAALLWIAPITFTKRLVKRDRLIRPYIWTNRVLFSIQPSAQSTKWIRIGGKRSIIKCTLWTIKTSQSLSNLSRSTLAPTLTQSTHGATPSQNLT